MQVIPLSELKQIPEAAAFIDWVPPWFEEALKNCFKFIVLRLQPYEKFNSDGGACLLVSGSGKVVGSGAGGRPISSGTPFGVCRTGENEYKSIPEWFQAAEPSIILCFNTNIFHNVCFGMGCGSMHVRVREMITSRLQEVH